MIARFTSKNCASAYSATGFSDIHLQISGDKGWLNQDHRNILVEMIVVWVVLTSVLLKLLQKRMTLVKAWRGARNYLVCHTVGNIAAAGRDISW